MTRPGTLILTKHMPDGTWTAVVGADVNGLTFTTSDGLDDEQLILTDSGNLITAADYRTLHPQTIEATAQLDNYVIVTGPTQFDALTTALRHLLNERDPTT